jgi:hypothetical protein
MAAILSEVEVRVSEIEMWIIELTRGWVFHFIFVHGLFCRQIQPFSSLILGYNRRAGTHSLLVLVIFLVFSLFSSSLFFASFLVPSFDSLAAFSHA